MKRRYVLICYLSETFAPMHTSKFQHNRMNGIGIHPKQTHRQTFIYIYLIFKILLLKYNYNKNV